MTNNTLSIVQQAKAIQDSYLDLDTTYNFRCNSQLKEDFKALCARNQITPSTAIKRYMLTCIVSGNV